MSIDNTLPNRVTSHQGYGIENYSLSGKRGSRLNQWHTASALVVAVIGEGVQRIKQLFSVFEVYGLAPFTE